MIQPSNIRQLRQLLAAYHIDTTNWGQGETKSLPDLLQEIQLGETTLEENPLRRVTTFVQVIIRHKDRVLIETRQEMASGAVRSRNRPLSEKMQPGETIESAARRGLKQELNLSPNQIADLSFNAQTRTAETISPSYPGLLTHYTIYTVEAEVTGLPLTDFTSNENSKTDPVRKHYWCWMPAIEAEDLF